MSTIPPARCGDVVIAYSEDGQTATYEFGVVTRVRGGLADAWQTIGGAIRPAHLVPGLRYRWFVPQTDIDVAQAQRTARDRDGQFSSLPDARDAMRPCLRGHEPEGDLEAGQ